MSMTRNNESDSLKSSIANLVRQNKKRDELINFLMERVETLTGAVNNLVLPAQNMLNTQTMQNSDNIQSDNIQSDNIQSDITTVLSNINNNENETENEISLDDVLNSIALTPASDNNNNDNNDNNNNDNNNEARPNINNSPHLPNTDQNDNKTEQESGQSELLNESEFDLLKMHSRHTDGTDSNIEEHEQTIEKSCITNLNLDDVLNSITTTYKDDDLISNILGADDSASNHCAETNNDNSDLPPEKLKLLGMNVKQLKQIAKDMNIKSRGNKTELVDNIWDKMSTNLT